MRLRVSLMHLLFAMLCLGAGCDARPANDEAQPIAAPSPWRDGAAVALDEHDAELEAAIEEARRTMEEARLRWQRAGETMRTRWAVKWAAATTDGGVEHLWVQPLHWSAFRVEGLLATEPINELALNNRNEDGLLALGDMVALPIEEVVDWVHYTTGDVHGPREGGFTIDVLEARFGRPE